MSGERPSRASLLGLGLYWTWVYLSFNARDIAGSLPDGSSLIPSLHIVSGFCGVIAFLYVIIRHEHLEKSPHAGAATWLVSIATTFGTLLYTLQMPGGASVEAVMTGAVVTGIFSPWIALMWGMAYCRLDAREAAVLTAGSFLVSGMLYAAISVLPQPFSGIAVAFMPTLSTFALYSSDPSRFQAPLQRTAENARSFRSEVSTMLGESGTGRLIVGIAITMAVCGGVRIYIMQAQPNVYANPVFIAAPIALVSLVFLAYGSTLSHRSISLGPLYRAAMPLFALAFVAVVMFDGEGRTALSFAAVSAGSTIIDMLTWVLVVEIVRSTHYSALLAVAIGRLAIHLGMASGEIAGLLAIDHMTAFFVVSIAALMLAMGYMFTDRATTFIFEPPMEGEIASMDAMDRETRAQAEGVAQTGAPKDARPDAPAKKPANASVSPKASESPTSMIARRYGLSPREAEVFELWATGHGAKAIQDKLVLSPSTVKTHVRHIYEKCDVHSRAEIIALIEEAHRR